MDYLKDTVWPDSCPFPEEKYFCSVGCGNTNIHWAMHQNVKISKYDTQQTLTPVLQWKTPHLIREDFEGEETECLARFIPIQLQDILFSNGNFTKTVAEKEAKSRGYNFTFYVVSSNDEQARFVSKLISSIPSRGFLMKGEDFFPKAKGRYETMGIDRCACLRGALGLHGSPGLVIDGGSALTYTAADSRGYIIGGGISPGLSLRFSSMSEGTSELPLVDTVELDNCILKALDEGPLSTFARNTKEAIIVSTLNEVASHLRSVIKVWLNEVGRGNDDNTDSNDTNSDRIISVTGGSVDLISKLLQPNNGGIIESYKGQTDDFNIAREKFLLHVGVSAVLRDRIVINNDEMPETCKVVTKDTLKYYIGQRVAKHFDKPTKDGDFIYRGSVNKKYDINSDGEQWYEIAYDDKDREDVTEDILDDMITLYKKVGHKTRKKRSIEPKSKKRKVTGLQHEPKYYVGRRVAKNFGEEIYFGKISKYAAESSYWHVVYDDGDEEDYNEKDLRQALKLYEENCVKSDVSIDSNI